jgi:hypothetical protein
MKMTREIMKQKKSQSAIVLVSRDKKSGEVVKSWALPSSEGMNRSYFQPINKPSDSNMSDKIAWLGRRALHKVESAQVIFNRTAKFEMSFN